MLEKQLQKVGKWADEKIDKASTVLVGAKKKLVERARTVKTRVQREIEASRLTPEEIEQKVIDWQSAVHAVLPLTCPKDHEGPDALLPSITNPGRKVVLVCPTCQYVQDEIPRAVHATDVWKLESIEPLSVDQVEELSKNPNPK